MRRQAYTVTFLVIGHHSLFTGTNLYCLMTEAHMCVNNLPKLLPESRMAGSWTRNRTVTSPTKTWWMERRKETSQWQGRWKCRTGNCRTRKWKTMARNVVHVLCNVYVTQWRCHSGARVGTYPVAAPALRIHQVPARSWKCLPGP